MSDYLGNLAARSLNLAGVLRPRLASIFEPLPAFGKRIEEYQYSNAVPGRADAVTRKQESRSEQPEPEGQKTTNFETLHNPSTSTPQFLQADPGRYALREQISSDRKILPESIVPADKMVRGATIKRFPISGDGHPFANDRQHRHPGPKHNASSLDEVSSEYIIQENYSHESGNSEINLASKTANAWPGELQPKAAHIQINERSGERLNRLEPKVPIPPAEIKPQSANLPIQDQLSLRTAAVPNDAGQIENPVDRLRSEASDEHSQFDPASKAANAWPGELQPKAAHLQFAVRRGERLNRPEPEIPMQLTETKQESAKLSIQDQLSLRAATAPNDAGQNENPVERLRSEAGDEHSQFDPASKANAWGGEHLKPKAAHLQFAVRRGERSNQPEPEIPMPLTEMKPESVNPLIQDQLSLRPANVPTDAGQNEDPVDRLRSEADDEHSQFDPASKAANAWAGEHLKPKAAHLQFAVRRGERLNQPEPEIPMPLTEMKPESVNPLIQDQLSLRPANVPTDAGQNEDPVDRLRSEADDEHSQFDPASKAANAWAGEPQPKAAHIRINVRRGERQNRPEPELPMPLTEMKPQSANPPIQDQLSLRAASAPNDAGQNENPVDRLRSEAGDEHFEFDQASEAANAWAGEHLKPKAAHIQFAVRPGERSNRLEPNVPISLAEIKPQSANPPIQDQLSLRAATAPNDAGQNENPVDRLHSEADDEHSELDRASKATNVWAGELQPKATHLQFAVHPGERQNRLEPEAAIPLAEIKPQSANSPIQDRLSLRAATAQNDAGQNENPVDWLRSEASDEHSELDQASKANAWVGEPQPKATHIQINVRSGERLNRLEPEASMPQAEMKSESVNLPIRDQPLLRTAAVPTDAGRNEIPVDRMRSEPLDEQSPFDQASRAANAWAGEPQPKATHIQINVRSGERLNRPETEAAIPLAEMKPQSVNLPIQDQPLLKTATAPNDARQNEDPVDRLRSEAADEHSEFDQASKAANAWPGELQPKADHLQFAVRPGKRLNRLEPEAPMPQAEMKPQSVNLPIQNQPSLRTVNVPTDAYQKEIPVELLRSEAVDEHSPFDQASKAANAWAREHPPRQPKIPLSKDLPLDQPKDKIGISLTEDLRSGSDDNSRAKYSSGKPRENVSGFLRDKATLKRSGNPAELVHAISRLAARPLKGPSYERKAEDSRKEKSEPSISVTIGRIEVRAVAALEKPVEKSSPKVQILSLDDYLRLRNGGQR